MRPSRCCPGAFLESCVVKSTSANHTISWSDHILNRSEFSGYIRTKLACFIIDGEIRDIWLISQPFSVWAVTCVHVTSAAKSVRASERIDRYGLERSLKVYFLFYSWDGQPFSVRGSQLYSHLLFWCQCLLFNQINPAMTRYTYMPSAIVFWYLLQLFKSSLWQARSIRFHNHDFTIILWISPSFIKFCLVPLWCVSSTLIV